MCSQKAYEAITLRSTDKFRGGSPKYADGNNGVDAVYNFLTSVPYSIVIYLPRWKQLFEDNLPEVASENFLSITMRGLGSPQGGNHGVETTGCKPEWFLSAFQTQITEKFG